MSLRLPEFCQSHWYLDYTLIVVFIQQGIMKIPVSTEEARHTDYLILSGGFVAYGELLGGIGLIIVTIMEITREFMHYAIGHNIVEPYGDFFTRFSVLYYVAS